MTAESKKKNNESIFKSYKLTVISKENFVEMFTMSISKFKFYLFTTLVFLFGIFLTVGVLFLTPMRQLIPGYPSSDMRDGLIYNALMVDSLEREISKRDRYLDQIRSVISGEIVENQNQEDAEETVPVEMEPMTDDSIFDALIGPDKYKFATNNNEQDFGNISRLNFFTPVNGVVINRYNAFAGHYAIDIVSDEYSHVASVLDGTVVFAEWSVSTGYVVQIQHDFNLISVYKHNSEVLVKSGDRVKAGDIVAIMGNEGELTTGPHLHFELWQNGESLDPEKYIEF